MTYFFHMRLFYLHIFAPLFCPNQTRDVIVAVKCTALKFVVFRWSREI